MPGYSYPPPPQTGLGYRTHPASLARDLVAYWPLDEARGNRYDRVGVTHMIEVGGAIGYADGVSGLGPRAAYFPNTGALALTAKPNVWHQNGDRSFTVSFWFMPYVVPAIMRIIQKEDTPSVGGLDWMICCGWPYTYNMTLAINTTAGAKTVWTAGAFGMQAYQWHHTVAWYDAESQSINISLSGYTPAVTYFAGAKLSPQYLNTLTFGRRGGGGSLSYPINGRLQDVAIWKRLLSKAERDALYQGGRGRRWFEQTISPTWQQRFWAYPPVIEPVMPASPIGGSVGVRLMDAPLGAFTGVRFPESPLGGDVAPHLLGVLADPPYGAYAGPRPLPDAPLSGHAGPLEGLT